jgi:mediator of replication checkpoint protein 1
LQNHRQAVCVARPWVTTQRNGIREAGSNGSDSNFRLIHIRVLDFLLWLLKREQRLAKEETEARKKTEWEEHLKAQSKNVRHARGSSLIAVSEDDSDDNAGGRRLTQQARPTRKASKKALEEMNRETQRMSRNMQLAHQAKTKKKITKESFAKFNFKPGGGVAPDTSMAASSATASSAPVSDFEGLQQHETPPTSPAYRENFLQKIGEGDKAPVLASIEPADKTVMDMEEELPTMEDVMTQPVIRVDKGKGKATEARPIEKSQRP